MRTIKTIVLSLLSVSLVAAVSAAADGEDDEKRAETKAEAKQDQPRRGPISGQRPIRAPLQGQRRFGPPDRPPGAPGRFPPGAEPGDDELPGRFGVPSAEEIQVMLDFLKEHFPDQYARIQAFRESDEDMRRIGRRIWPRLSGIISTFRRNPELGRLMIQEHQIEATFREKIHAYRAASAENQKQLSEEIRSLIARQFDIRQKRRSLEIEELEERLAEQKRILQERSERKEEIINRELARRLHPELEF